jgi:hypothetical protein
MYVLGDRVVHVCRLCRNNIDRTSMPHACMRLAHLAEFANMASSLPAVLTSTVHRRYYNFAALPVTGV